MIPSVKSRIAYPQSVEMYLGFEVIRKDDTRFIATPRGWAQARATLLEASDLPSMRKRIWAWWHALLD